MVKADCFRFRLRPGRTDPRFLSMQLSSTASAATACLSTGATRLRINLQAAAARSVALPSLEEQERIVAFVASATEPLNVNVNRLEHEVELLLEYRTRLVADVVTGRLDVREVAARLPEEDLPELVDDLTSESEFANEEAAA